MNSQDFSPKYSIDNLSTQNNELVDFFMQIINSYTANPEFNDYLQNVLELVGKFLDAQRISVLLADDAGAHEVSWINTSFREETQTVVFQYGLPNLGFKNHIKFFIKNPSFKNYSESIYILIANLIDMQLASHQAILAEHSQRVLAESINQISEKLSATLDRDLLLSIFLDELAKMVPYDSASVMLL
ncbi:MAG: hypothetical protein ACPL1K_00005, partial [Candidatus Kryptoniota bacterium]